MNLIELKNKMHGNIKNYSKVGIDIELLELSDSTVKVKIAQNRLVNGYMLTQKELVTRAKGLFESTGLKVVVIPSVYSVDVSNVTVQWITQKMEEFAIRRKDIIKQLPITESALSLYMSEERSLTLVVKGAFYHYFKNYELNRYFRNN